MSVNYRKANLKDIDYIMEIIEDGRAFLKPQNGGQWQDGYPDRNTIINDINNQVFYVILNDNKQIVAVLALTYHEDDYDHLYEGKWLTNLPYIVMHRCAVKKEFRGQGFGKKIFEVFEIEAKKQGYKSLRIDTHENNAPMRAILDKFGFVCCGKAILKPNKDRLVFEKLI